MPSPDAPPAADPRPLPGLHAEADRVEAVAAELTAGMAGLAGLGAAVSVFGSARTPPGDPAYDRAQAVGRELARAGLAIITGGGGGSMEAVSRGAQKAGGRSVGLVMEPSTEQAPNRYLDLDLRFSLVFVRKILFLRFARAFVVLPGGFGTLDELFEALALIQTRRIADFPVILCERDYWEGLLAWLRDGPLARGMIARDELDLLVPADDPAQVAAIASAAAGAQSRTPAPRR